MVLPRTLQTLEVQKFKETDEGEVAVRTCPVGIGEFKVTGLSIGGRITVVSLDSTSWKALPATALAERNGISIQNQTDTEIKIGYDNTEPGYVGVIVGPSGERFYNITPDITIYAKASSGTPDIVVEELA